MTPHFMLLILLAISVDGSAGVTHLQANKPKPALEKETLNCWAGESEIQNKNPSKHRPTRLPPEFAHAKVKQSLLLLKLCVSETGSVVRVLILQSSGNPEIDNYYINDLSKWNFVPVERNDKPVRSVVPVTVTLYVK